MVSDQCNVSLRLMYWFTHIRRPEDTHGAVQSPLVTHGQISPSFRSLDDHHTSVHSFELQNSWKQGKDGKVSVSAPNILVVVSAHQLADEWAEEDWTVSSVCSGAERLTWTIAGLESHKMKLNRVSATWTSEHRHAGDRMNVLSWRCQSFQSSSIWSIKHGASSPERFKICICCLWPDVW